MGRFNLKTLIFTLLLSVNLLQASTLVQLTHKEKLFLQEHPVITLGTGDNWAPYIMKDSNGKNIGYDNDILTKINKATGAHFIQFLGNWDKVQELAKEKKLDGLSTLAAFKERKQWFNFSNSYISLQKMLLVKEGNPLHIKSKKDLDGKTIVINKGNMVDEKIAKMYNKSKIIYADTVEEMLKKVIKGKADATFGNGSTTYMISKLGLPYFDIAYPLDYSLDLVFAVRKDWPQAISILNKGLQTISKFERTQLIQKWFIDAQQATNHNLTLKERGYLKKKKEITMCIDPNWMPFEQYKNGKYIGMSSDYFQLFQQELGIPIRLIPTTSWTQSLKFAQDRTCDILSLAKETPSGKRYFNFTKPYFIESAVLATKQNVPFIDTLKSLENQKIGVLKGYSFKEILLQTYPNLHIVDIKSIQDGLNRVVENELFGVIDTLPTIAYLLQNEFLGQLKISSKITDKWVFSIAVRNDELTLLNIFNKAIDNLPKNTYTKILNNYVGLQYEPSFDYALFWIIFAIFSALLLLVYIKYYVTQQYNDKVKTYFTLVDNYFLTSATDKEGYITEVSKAFCTLTGYRKEELIGKKHNILRHPAMPSTVFRDLWETILKAKKWHGEIESLKKDGSSYWTDITITPIFTKNGDIKGFNALRFDITDKVLLRELSNTDKLTQIANRLYLDTQYTKQMDRAKRYETIFSVIMIDIDFFKKVNDKHGHKVGDEILITLAQIFKKNIRSLDILGRWGGEEFLIICTETDLTKAKILAEKIRKKVETFDFPIVKHLTCSFGVAEYVSSDEHEDTFKRADQALYNAKHNGRNRVEVV